MSEDAVGKFKLSTNQMKTIEYHLSYRGFFSELNCLVKAYIFAKSNGMEFQLVDSESPLYFNLGFSNYFQNISDPIEVKRAQADAGERIVVKFPNQMFHDIMRTPTSFSEFRDAFNSTLKYQPKIQKQIEQNIEKLNLPDNYASMHIRWGDKVGDKLAWTSARLVFKRVIKNLLRFKTPRISLNHEAVKFKVSDYFKLLREHDHKVKNIFILSDDFRSVEQAKDIEPEFYQLFSLCEENMTGHSTLIRKKQNDYSSEKEVVTFLTEFEIALRSNIFIGTLSSNVGISIWLNHSYPQRCFSLDKIGSLYAYLCDSRQTQPDKNPC